MPSITLSLPSADRHHHHNNPQRWIPASSKQQQQQHQQQVPFTSSTRPVAVVVSVVHPSLPASLTRPLTATRPPTQGALPISRQCRSISSPPSPSSSVGRREGTADDEPILSSSFKLASTKKAVHSKSSGSVNAHYATTATPTTTTTTTTTTNLFLQPIKNKIEGGKPDIDLLKQRALPPTSSIQQTNLPTPMIISSTSSSSSPAPYPRPTTSSSITSSSTIAANNTKSSTTGRPRATSDPPRVEMPEGILSRIRDHKMKDMDPIGEEVVRYTGNEEAECGDDRYYDVYRYKDSTQTEQQPDDTSPTSTQFKPLGSHPLPVEESGSPTSTQLPKTRSKRGGVHKLPLTIPVLHKTQSKSGARIILDGDQSPCSNRVVTTPDLSLVYFHLYSYIFSIFIYS